MYVVICLLVLTACGSEEDQLLDNKIDTFSFSNQHGKDFGLDDLIGEVWIASFIFTNCETVCPPMMFEMASLQETFAEEDIQAELVSFTVDPNVDSPAVLEQYIQKYTDNETNWHMVTGYSQDEIEVFAREQFQTIVQKPDATNQVIHGTNFYLIDDEGYVLNEYNYMDDTYVEEIMEDIKKIR